MQSIMIYMLVYLVMNLGAFLVVILVAEATGSESILDYRGLAKRHPLAAMAFAIFLFSLTGLPPFAGFVGKWYLFYAVFERIDGPGGGWYASLALIGALNTAVSLYYYVRIVRAMFIDPPYSESARLRSARASATRSSSAASPRRSWCSGSGGRRWSAGPRRRCSCSAGSRADSLRPAARPVIRSGRSLCRAVASAARGRAASALGPPRLEPREVLRAHRHVAEVAVRRDRRRRG